MAAPPPEPRERNANAKGHEPQESEHKLSSGRVGLLTHFTRVIVTSGKSSHPVSGGLIRLLKLGRVQDLLSKQELGHCGTAGNSPGLGCRMQDGENIAASTQVAMCTDTWLLIRLKMFDTCCEGYKESPPPLKRGPQLSCRDHLQSCLEISSSD
ncbi:hypothetical protein J6590_030763 [Homalodisca vitripennis]|nr:hypothetical protein J6590_030763 [Homalodisca vitripennis]